MVTIIIIPRDGGGGKPIMWHSRDRARAKEEEGSALGRSNRFADEKW
jgi:hypothetical protein